MSFSDVNFNIYYNNTLIKQTDQMKILGWIIDRKLKFDRHSLYLIKTLNKSLHILSKFRYQPIYVRKLLFYALFESHLKFSNPILLNISKSDINSIKCKFKYALTSLRLDGLPIINDYSRNIHHTNCKFIYDIIRNKIPIYLHDIIDKSKSRRGKNIFLLPLFPFYLI